MLNPNSSWPLQGLVITMAQAVESVSEEDRRGAILKQVERCIRAGARLAAHFGVSAEKFRDLAEQEISREKVGVPTLSVVNDEELN